MWVLSVIIIVKYGFKDWTGPQCRQTKIKWSLNINLFKNSIMLRNLVVSDYNESIEEAYYI